MLRENSYCQERPGSLLLTEERDGGARTCPGAVTRDRDGDGSHSPKTLPDLQEGKLWGDDRP